MNGKYDRHAHVAPRVWCPTEVANFACSFELTQSIAPLYVSPLSLIFSELVPDQGIYLCKVKRSLPVFDQDFSGMYCETEVPTVTIPVRSGQVSHR